MPAKKPNLTLLPGDYSVARLEPQATIPNWVRGGGFWAVVHTQDELSLVCQGAYVPEDVRCESNWRLLRVTGPLDFSLVGLLAGLAGTLAAAEVSIFTVSTFDTDYLMVRGSQLEAALEALQRGGYIVNQE